MCRRLRQRDACTAETRMVHLVYGGQKQNGIRKTGPRHGETQDARNVLIGSLDMTRREKAHEGGDNAPKREGRVLAPNSVDLSANRHEAERR